MPFQILRQDITRVHADAIVNTANPYPTYGRGSDYAVYQAAGAEQLLAARQLIGVLRPGEAAVTPGFALPAKFIIHTVGPCWVDGTQGEAETLATCYRECLRLAREYGCHSIAFPMISTGVYGFPRDLALRIALDCVHDFLSREENDDMDIRFVVFGPASLHAARLLFPDIEEYIDAHYVQAKTREEYGPEQTGRFSLDEDFALRNEVSAPPDEDLPCASMPCPPQAVEAMRSERLEAMRSERPEAMHADRLEAPKAKKAKNGLFGRIRAKDKAPSAPPKETARSPIESPDADMVCGAPLRESRPKPRRQEAPPAPTAAPREKPRSLEELLRLQQETFQESLLRLIAEKGMKNAQVYHAANMSKQLFAKIKADRNYIPKKNTAIALALALRLNLDETRDLLVRAGYALSPGIPLDRAIQYFIENGVYDVLLIDTALFDLGLPMLTFD